jgi:RNA polymerase sigma-70 factor (ECF subfamily)
MTAHDRETIEQGVRSFCERGDYAAGATLSLKGYGPEIFGFLVAVHRSESEASDIFSQVAEAIWLGLPTFAWESTLRTWAYGVARNLSKTSKRNAARRERRGRRTGDSALEFVAKAVRTTTLEFLRTEKKTRLQLLRDALPEEDRILLVLRVDRGLSWNDLAHVLAEGGGETRLDKAAVAKEAARLRKHFQVVKDRLREKARKEGLVV